MKQITKKELNDYIQVELKRITTTEDLKQLLVYVYNCDIPSATEGLIHTLIDINSDECYNSLLNSVKLLQNRYKG